MITVTAAPGLKLPKEGKPRQYIEDTPVEVPETAYYLRALACGDLVRVESAPVEAAPKSSKASQAKAEE